MDGREGSRTSNSCCPCLAPGTVSASSSRCGRTTHSIPPHAQFRSAGRLPVQSSPIQSEPCAGCQRSLQIGQSIRGRDETRRVAAASVPCTCVLARAPASPRSGKVRLGPVVEQLQHSNHHTPPAISSSSRDRARRRCRESLPPSSPSVFACPKPTGRPAATLPAMGLSSFATKLFSTCCGGKAPRSRAAIVIAQHR